MMKHVDAYNEAVMRMLQKFDLSKLSTGSKRCSNKDIEDDHEDSSSEEIEANNN
jgi:hypothetical protein